MGLKGSAAKILVPDTTAQTHQISAVLATQYYTRDFNVMADALYTHISSNANPSAGVVII